MSKTIRFNMPIPVGNELEYLRQATEHGRTSMSGPFSDKVSELLREVHGASDVLLTTSCTDGLEMAAVLLDITPGDVVIVPSFTFVSSALAFVRAGARIRFCDIEPETLGLDATHLGELMDDKVRAVVAVHYAGVGCQLDEIAAVMKTWPRAELVEDNAHGLFGSYKGEALGTRGRFSTLSFHETKNFVCGEGGALVLNTDEDIERAHILRDKGTNRRSFKLGQVDRYTWVDTGSSFGLSDLLAAYLLAQLEERALIQNARSTVTQNYIEALTPQIDDFGVTLPIVPAHCESAHHMFYVMMPNRTVRDGVIAHMVDNGVQPTFHYVPLHSSPGGQKYADGHQECPVTDDVSGRLLRMPFYNTLGIDDVQHVVGSFFDALRTIPSASFSGAAHS